MNSQPVLVCRPGARARPLVDAIAALGVPVVQGDMMQLEALEETPAMRRVWLDFDLFRRVMVVSPFAAECLADALDRYWPQLPIGIDYYAVGAATAETLQRLLGVEVNTPPVGIGEDTSEALLTSDSLQQLDNQRVLLVAGEGGRTLFADTLKARGAQMTRLAVYRRLLIPPPSGLHQHLCTGDYQALVVSSGEILEHLARWCSQAALNQPLIVSSSRLATLAGKLGFRLPVVALGATPAALAAAVARVRDPETADIDHDDLEKG